MAEHNYWAAKTPAERRVLRLKAPSFQKRSVSNAEVARKVQSRNLVLKALPSINTHRNSPKITEDKSSCSDNSSQILHDLQPITP